MYRKKVSSSYKRHQNGCQWCRNRISSFHLAIKFVAVRIPLWSNGTSVGVNGGRSWEWLAHKMSIQRNGNAFRVIMGLKAQVPPAFQNILSMGNCAGGSTRGIDSMDQFWGYTRSKVESFERSTLERMGNETDALPNGTPINSRPEVECNGVFKAGSRQGISHLAELQNAKNNHAHGTIKTATWTGINSTLRSGRIPSRGRYVIKIEEKWYFSVLELIILDIISLIKATAPSQLAPLHSLITLHLYSWVLLRFLPLGELSSLKRRWRKYFFLFFYSLILFLV